MIHQHKGSVVVYIVLLSTSVFIILLGLLNQASVILSESQDRYYRQVASEAAEAGASYALACLNRSGYAQTWGPGANGGPRPNLAPNTDCQGTATLPSPTYVLETTKVRTTFNVGNLDALLNEGALISSTGTAFVLASDGSTADTINFSVKRNVKWLGNAAAEPFASSVSRTCAIRDGSVYCWGWNRYGQLGNGEAVGSGDVNTSSTADSKTPVRVRQVPGGLAGTDATSLFTALHHSCALAAGEVYCWGWNEYGQLGNGTAGNFSSVPVKVEGLLAGKTVTAIGGSGNTSCAIAEGKIYCWGLNSSGPYARGIVGVNDGSTTYFSTPQAVTAGNTATTLATAYTATALTSTGSGSYNMCAIADDEAYCWGNNDRGAVGDNTTTDRLLPTKVLQESGALQGKTVVAIAQDGNNDPADGSLPHVCVVATDSFGANGEVYCWGDNVSGQLGDGTTSLSLKPVAALASSGDELFNKEVTSVTVGIAHSCVIADNLPYCWGEGSLGQLGNNTTTNYSEPVAVSTLPNDGMQGLTVVGLNGGANHSCAIIDDARVYCWGGNSEAQLGDSTVSDRTVPTESLYLRPQTTSYYF
jgi:alpha-tubulin suppressor-like RCC1 family protein